jgi:hypothetical protein
MAAGTMRGSSVFVATSIAAMPSPRTACTANAAATAHARPVNRLPMLLTANPTMSRTVIDVRAAPADSSA